MREMHEVLENMRKKQYTPVVKNFIKATIEIYVGTSSGYGSLGGAVELAETLGIDIKSMLDRWNKKAQRVSELFTKCNPDAFADLEYVHKHSKDPTVESCLIILRENSKLENIADISKVVKALKEDKITEDCKTLMHNFIKDYIKNTMPCLHIHFSPHPFHMRLHPLIRDMNKFGIIMPKVSAVDESFRAASDAMAAAFDGLDALSDGQF